MPTPSKELDAQIDTGIVGAVVLLASFVGVISVPGGLVVYESSQAIGIAYDVLKIDWQGMGTDAALQALSPVKEAGRLAPAVGAAINVYDMWADLQKVERTDPIYKPYPDPFTLPPVPG